MVSDWNSRCTERRPFDSPQFLVWPSQKRTCSYRRSLFLHGGDRTVNDGCFSGLGFGWNRHRSWLKKPGKDLIALPGKGEILVGDSSFIMRGERQRHLVKTYVDIRVVIDFLSLPGDPIDKVDAF